MATGIPPKETQKCKKFLLVYPMKAKKLLRVY